MSWLKRNWVDALMVALIVAVVGGILALLVRGGTGTQATTPPSAQPAVTTTPQNTAPSSSAPANPVAPTPPPAPTPPRASVDPSAKPVQIPQIPAFTPAPSNPTPQPSPQASVAPSSTGSNADPVLPQRPALAQRPVPRTASREPLNYTRADFLRNYRVAVATYSSAARAQGTANRLAAAGYPAQAFSSGNAYIVVVGPYARESNARAAYTKLRSQGYADAVLYKPNGERERAAVARSGPTPNLAPSTPAGNAGSSPVQLDPGLSYLQVGAFKNTQSALPMLNRLKGSGFKTLLRSANDGYTRVLVGPFNAASLQSARLNLSEQGYTPFTVRE